LLNYFDKADAAYVSAYRKHDKNAGTFEISLEYLSSPELDDRIVIISDPMLATGASLVKTIQYLRAEGEPSQIHIVCAIACSIGIELVRREVPAATLWCGAVDEELTAKGYIVPGLGDAGDLAYGVKIQM
jgi:uracil phosphoribosyltransferase